MGKTTDDYECGALRGGCLIPGSFQELHLITQDQSNVSCSKESVFSIFLKKGIYNALVAVASL